MNEFKCRQCGEIYPNQEEYFNKSARNNSGFDTLCKKCKSYVDATYRENNKNKISKRKKIKYNEEVKPISHDLYVNQVLTDPIGWRAKVLRQGMQQRSVLDNLCFDNEYFSIDRIKNIITEQKQCLCCSVLFCYPSLLDGTKNSAAPSADKIDSTKGYTQSNVVFICWRCNNLKRDTTAQDLQIVVNWLENKLGG